MQEDLEKITQKAESIRDVIRYIKRFNNATLVVHLDDEVSDSLLFNRHCRDLAMLANSGIKLVIIAGAKQKIDKILTEYKHKWSYINQIRVTNEDSIPFIKMATFDISTGIMNALSAEKITGVIGNWVRARCIGIRDGVDFGSAGLIDSVFVNDLKAVMEKGFVPIFPCIGWSSNGKAYNISSTEIALTVAKSLNADKLFFIKKDSSTLSKEASCFFANNELPNSISVQELPKLIKSIETEKKASDFCSFLKNAYKACTNGIKRTHFLNGSIEGVIPCEIFSETGSGGFMVYSNQYGTFRQAQNNDISSMLSIMEPFVQKGILLPRTSELLEKDIQNFSVYDIDEEIRATAALYFYKEEKMAEIAALAVSPQYSGSGIGQELVSYLIKKAKEAKINKVFILTTQTGDWFESCGFSFCDIDSLPQKRKEIWSKKRASRMMIMNLTK